MRQEHRVEEGGVSGERDEEDRVRRHHPQGNEQDLVETALPGAEDSGGFRGRGGGGRHGAIGF